jgi:hypothetical protein
MGFSCNIHTLHTAHTYAAAHQHFERTPLPRGSAWAHNERPLGGQRARHYRVTKGTDGSYGVYLYSTCMARHYPPAEDGALVTEYGFDARQASSQFMWRVLGIRRSEPDLAGAQAYWGMSGAQVEGRYCNAYIVRQGNRIDTARSEVVPAYTLVYSTEQKEMRKTCTSKFQHLIQIALMRTEADTRDGKVKTASRFWAGETLKDMYRNGPSDNPAQAMQIVDALVDVSLASWSPLVNKRESAMKAWIRKTLVPYPEQKKFVELWKEPPQKYSYGY